MSHKREVTQIEAIAGQYMTTQLVLNTFPKIVAFGINRKILVNQRSRRDFRIYDFQAIFTTAFTNLWREIWQHSYQNHEAFCITDFEK